MSGGWWRSWRNDVLSLPYFKLPGRSPLPPLTPELSALSAELLRDVSILAGDIGPRNTLRPAKLNLAAEFCRAALQKAGFSVNRSIFDADGVQCANLEAVLPGTRHPERIVVVGAHYDSVHNCPAANDNGSGVAGTLAIARRLASRPQPCTIRFVMFANEEPPHFHTDTMGSLVYARACRAANDEIRAMFTLETIGCYLHEPGSQRWPQHPLTKLLPNVGNFILLCGDTAARHAVKISAEVIEHQAGFPTLAAAVPAKFGDIGWSDHWSFQQNGYPAFTVTDTALFRYNHYHRPTDTPERLDYDSMARVVDGMLAATIALAERGG